MPELPNRAQRVEADASPELHAGLVGMLLRDRLVQLMTLVLVLAGLPFLLPLLSDGWREFYGRRLVEIPFFVALFVAVLLRLRHVEDSREWRFWLLLGLGFFCWSVASFLGPAMAWLQPGSPPLGELLQILPYLMFYGLLATSLEIHPHVRQDPITRALRILNWLASFTLLSTLLLYFVAIPAMRSDTSLWLSGFSLFLPLDCYVAARLWYLRAWADTRQWRWIYSCLFVATLVWGAADATMLLINGGLVADPGWGTLLDLVWSLGFVLALASTRVRDPSSGNNEVGMDLLRPRGMGPLVVYMLTPLLLHSILYRFTDAAPELRVSREGLVLAVTALLGALTLIYHRLLHVEIRRLTEQEAETRELLTYQAFHDELTGLPNRNLFRDRLQMAIVQAQRQKSKVGVLFCDLDQFKVINDSLGHEAGDQALMFAAQRLRASLRKQDTVARLGGDEFAVVLQGIRKPLDAAHLAEKCLDALAAPIVLNRKNHVLSGSIGVTIYPDDGDSEETLVKNADIAMYQAKLQGRNTFRLFTEAMNEAAEERLAVEQGLRAGLLQEQFTLFYQPIVGLDTGRPVAFEALLRWKHPDRGYISPLNFMDVAEQTGIILDLGKWVIETACAWAVTLDPVEGELPAISVNMSPRQFRDPELATYIAGVLAKTGLDPARLYLEITESMVVTVDATVDILQELRKLGVRVAIDDFGTGYAALSRLQEMPVDIVKIDRSFVSGIVEGSVSEAIVLAIVNMARALNFYVVAEGIECESELAVVTQAGCHAVQGFYLCTPLPAEDIAARLASPEAISIPVKSEKTEQEESQ